MCLNLAARKKESSDRTEREVCKLETLKNCDKTLTSWTISKITDHLNSCLWLGRDTMTIQRSHESFLQRYSAEEGTLSLLSQKVHKMRFPPKPIFVTSIIWLNSSRISSLRTFKEMNLTNTSLKVRSPCSNRILCLNASNGRRQSRTHWWIWSSRTSM